jgi:hypothetical protein
MNKPNVTKFLNTAKYVMKKRSPEILTGIGIAGMISTVVLAVKATPKAMELIEEEKKFKEKEAHEGGIFTEEDERNALNLTPVETVKAAWKPYIPAAITGIASVACLIGANSVHVRRNAALATAYQLSTTALSDYREKVVETIGEKKENNIRDKVAKKQVEEHPVADTQIIMTGKGNTLCYDSHSDRYFRSDIDKIKNAVLTLNERMINGNEMYISLNDFYDEIGLKHTEVGNSIGWRIDKGKIDVRYSAQITEDNEPCIVIDHLMPPEYGFDSYY